MKDTKTTQEPAEKEATKTVQVKTAQEAVEKEVTKTPEIIAAEEAKELVQLVVFELDQEEYAVEIGEAREILRKTEVTPIPNSPEFIEGIINVRGKIVVVLDLEKRFNLVREHPEKGLNIIISEIGENTYGAIVDEVTEVLRVPKDAIEPAPAIISEKIKADYVKGVGILENRLLLILDFKKVFEEKELAQLGELVRKQAQVARKKMVTEQPKEEEKEETKEERKEKVEEMVKEKLMKKGAKPEKKEEKATPKEEK